MFTLKRIVALVLAFVLCAGMAGCGGNEGDTREVVTLTWYIPGAASPDLAKVLDEANKISEDKIGVRLDIRFIDSATFDERMRVIMSSGEEFDLCFTGYINKYNTAARLGGLEPLDELLETTPQLRDSIPDNYWDALRIDGKIYAVPNQQIVATYFAAWIPKRLADKYKFDVNAVREHADLEPFMKAVKEGEEGIYPWRNNNAYFAVGARFEEITDGFGIRRGDKDCRVVFIDEQPEWIAGINLRHSWYEKGYIRPDVLTVGDDSRDYVQGKYAINMSGYKPGGEVGIGNQLGEKMVYTPSIDKPYLSQRFMTSALTGISSTCKHKKEAIKLIELINTDKEYYNLICFGIEGEHYTKVDDNTIRFAKDSRYNPEGAWKFGNQFNAYITEGMDPDVWDETQRMNSEAEVSPLLGFTLDTSNIENEISRCETTRSQYGYCYFMGAKKADDSYNEYLAMMEEAGKDKIIKEMQSQVDAFLARKSGY